MVSNRMKQVIVRTIATLRPNVFYTAGDVIHHAQKIDARARCLHGNAVSRYMVAVRDEGLVEMHRVGIEDDAGKTTHQRTWTVVE